MKNQNHAQEHTDSQWHKPQVSVRTCRPCSFTRLCLYCMLVNKSVQTLVTEPKVVNVFSWVKESTENQSDPSVSHHTAEYCKAARWGKRKKRNNYRAFENIHLSLGWWHRIAIPGELWVLQESREDIAGTHWDPAALEEQYFMKVYRSCKRQNDLQQEEPCLPCHPDTPGTQGCDCSLPRNRSVHRKAI